MDRAHVSIQPSAYHMIGTTRDICVELKLSNKELVSVEKGLRLKELVAQDELGVPIDENTCSLYSKFKKGKSVKAYKIIGRPAVLQLKSGGAFEYLLLFYDPTTGDTCVLASYAYG